MKRSLTVLIILYFIKGIATNIHHPLMPSYVDHLNLPKYMFGFLFAFMNLGMMLGSPYFGNLSDQGKKKSSLIVGLLIYGFAQLLFGLGDYFNGWILSALRLISGFGIAASFTVLTSEMVTISDKGNRARNLGIAAALTTLGGSIGQFIGGFVHTNSFFVRVFGMDKFFNVLLLQFGFVMILILLVVVLFKPKEQVVVNTEKRAQFWEGFKEVKNISKELLFFMIALVLITIAATNVDKYIDVFISDSGYLANTIGNFKMVSGIVSIFASLLVVPVLVKFKDKINVMIALQVLSAIITVFVFRISPLGIIVNLYTFFMFYVVLKTSFAPLEQEHVASFAKADNISKTMGLRQAFYASGTIIGPIFGAFIYEYNPKLLFDISAVLFIIAIVFLVIGKKLKNQTNNIETLESNNLEV